jgi:hypothetical protein
VVLNSVMTHNRAIGFGTAGFPGIFYVGPGRPSVIASTLG